MLNRNNIQKLKKWTGFVGIFLIVVGILYCLTIIGAIAGVFLIIFGVKLNNVKKQCKELLDGSKEQSDGYDKLNAIFDNLGSFFKIQGILIIVGLVLTIATIALAIAAGVMFSSGGEITDLINTYIVNLI